VITKYICELCGEEFTDFQQALDHEYHDKVHIGPDVYQVKPLRYLPKDAHCVINDPRPYPLDIAVPMNDGALVRYSFVGIITPAPPPEPESEDVDGQIKPEVTE